MSEKTNAEINREIHEKVIGECWHEWTTADGFNYYCENCPSSAVETSAVIPQGFNYCGNISDAFKVVEKMREQWLKDDPETDFWRFTDCGEYGWRVEILFGHHDGDGEVATAVAETLPKAICLAVIKAV